MAKYIFDVSPCGARLEITKLALPPAGWKDLAASDKVDSAAGNVNDSQANTLDCCTENNSVITLLNANWDLRPSPDQANPVTGPAKCNLCERTPTDQTWTLVDYIA